MPHEHLYSTNRRTPHERLELVTGAERLPITAGEARAQLRLEHREDDAILEKYIRSATAEAEQVMGRELIAKDYRLYLERFEEAIWIDPCKLLDVTAVLYDDADGNPQVVPSSVYEVARNGDYPGWIQLAPGQSWPALDPIKRLERVRVELRAGYGDNWDDIPDDIQAALRERIAFFYEVREPIVIGTIASEVPGNAGLAYSRHQVVEFPQ